MKEKPGADEALRAEDTKPAPKIKEFEIKKGVNPYGFLHIPKKARGSLPFQQGVPLKAKIEGETLILRAE